MNKLVKEAWVARLRSGDYKQGEGQLFDGERHCCLGVLCELYKDTKGGKWSEPDVEDVKIGDPRFFMEEEGILPEKVRKWAGLDRQDPVVELETDQGVRMVSLSELNDGSVMTNGKRAGFKSIAKIIEKKL